MIEPVALRYFRKVAAHGSVRQAAERLFVAQSAVSRQITLLETALGVPLFERHARGMALTAAGQLLLDYANDSSARFDALRGNIHEYETLARGHVEIASVEGMMTSFLPRFVRSFSDECPGITLSIVGIGSQAVAEAVAEHRYDLGLLFGAPTRTDLVELGRMNQPLHVIVAPAHPLAQRASCALADLDGYSAVLPERSFGIRQLLDRACLQGRVTLHKEVETNTLAFATRVVAQTGLIAFMPKQSIAPELLAGQLVAVPLTDRLLKGTRITLVASYSRRLSRAAEHAASRLRQQMAAD